ncbi:MAG: PspC domain-containing protein [Chloroflexales bacterium]|nr:PspC domain-containing protein [Chloroflexales bacterium]
MQPRLTRSRNEAMLAGVCGGLGEYFGVDPVIVRFIFVIVTLTSGLGVPVYAVLWLIMPKAAPNAAPPPPAAPHNFGREVSQLGQQLGQEAAQFGREMREVFVAQPRSQSQQRADATMQPPDPSSYKFDPLTGQPVRPTVGETTNLGEFSQLPAVQADLPQPPLMPPPRRNHSWRNLGVSLVIVGALIFLNQLDIQLDFVFPLVLIVAGLVMMRRR